MLIQKNKAEKLLITKAWPQKTNPNKAKNKADKLLKKRSCGKNKPKTNPKTNLSILLKKLEGQKNEPELIGAVINAIPSPAARKLAAIATCQPVAIGIESLRKRSVPVLNYLT